LPASAIIQAPTLIGCLVVKERSAVAAISYNAPGIAAVSYRIRLGRTYFLLPVSSLRFLLLGFVSISESCILHCFRYRFQLIVALSNFINSFCFAHLAFARSAYLTCRLVFAPPSQKL
jgi:hypothetical protein